MKLDRSELLLRATATHFLTVAVSNLHLSLRAAAAFERASDKTIKEEQAQQAAYFQFLALQADDAARMCGIESNEMHKFMHLFFASNVDWSQIK